MDDMMDGNVLVMLEDFVSEPLVTWIQTLGSLVNPRCDQSPSLQETSAEGPKEFFLKLVNGDFLIHIMEMIDLIPGGARPSWSDQSEEGHRLQMLQTVLHRLTSFYQNDLQQLIVLSPPNVYLLARDPLTAQAVGEMRKLLLLLLGSAVQCERREEIIGRIQMLDIDTQAALASAIQEVTQEPKNVLRLNWKELRHAEMEEFLQDLMSQIQGLVRERDAVLEKLWELQQDKETWPLVPPTNNNCQHLGVQLAEARVQVRRLQQMLEEKMEELLDLQDELKDLEGQLQKMREENRGLEREARLTMLYRDELDALQEKVLRTERLQTELTALRSRLPALEQCQAQLKEEREFSQALLDTKAMLEEQLETACTRGKHLKQLEKEKRHLQSSLTQMQQERDQLNHQIEELLRENVALERQLKQSLTEPLDVLWSEKLEYDYLPHESSDAPILLNYEMKESGRLLVLEQENAKLSRRLQEELQSPVGSRSLDPESENTEQDKELESRENQAGLKVGKQSLPESREQQEPKDLGLERKGKQETEERVARMETALSEAQTLLREAEQSREKVSHQMLALEDRLRSLQEAHGNTLEKHEQERAQWQLETEHLLEEVQALEREQEALRAGSQALQTAATQTELELWEARQSLQGERLKGAQLAQKAQQAEEDMDEARRELEAMRGILEQHKVTVAQLGAEKALLEDLLSQAETQQRQLDKDNRRLKAQTQAQEEALVAQSIRLVHLEAQAQRQAMELSSLQEAAQVHKELEQEAAVLREQLKAKCQVSAILEEELQKEKERRNEKEQKEKEKSATLTQKKEQLLEKEESLQVDMESKKCSEAMQGEPSNKKMELEEESGAHRRQHEEKQDFMSQRTSNHQAKNGGVIPLVLEELPMAQLSETQSRISPDLLPLQSEGRSKALSLKLNEVEHKNAVLQAEKSTLTERLGQLQLQISNLQGALSALQGQSSDAKEESGNGKWQAENSALKVEVASLRSQQVLLDSQLSDLRQRQSVLETEAQRAQHKQEEWRGRFEALLRDHDRLTVLHERQGADLEGLLGKHTRVKGTLRHLEQEHRELQDRHSQLLGQKSALEQREEALQGQKMRLEETAQLHRELEEQHNKLKEEHERVKKTLTEMEQGWDDLQAELQGMRNRVTGLQLDHARLEAESAALKEQNQQLDTALGRLSTQCELLAQLKGNQEEENRHLLQEIQALSRENRRLLERNMESKEHFQEEQRQYLDKLGELRREKQKLVEKIMDQYRVLEPTLPRGKKSNWIAEKIRKLMKPRREAPREHMRLMAEVAGSSESLSGQEEPEADISSIPSSPASLHKASSTLSILDAQQVHFRRRRLSSRMPAVDSSGSGDGEGQDTPRQRFRQRRLGMLGGSYEEAVIAEAKSEVPSQVSTITQEKRSEEK
ncbi:coiled-coil domain-containing protein 88B [Sceloporus undulatus]|uniref:coiled-coil domain-containing protein 88B n=1 Tax=Sceloporus undulatus TaxID=8520 RepID=UPI001C4D6838|nr:coiled-coil domain-containing protein 88B [Sceloporus undulatus]